MPISQLEGEAMDSKAQQTASDGCFIKSVKYFLAGIKAISAASQTFFGTQSSVSYTDRDENVLSLTNLIISIINSINSLLYTSATGSH